MRIALVHYAAPPVIGGVERVLEQQAQILAMHGHEVVVVSGNKGAKVQGAIMEYAPNFYIKRLRSAFTGCEVIIVHNMFTMPFAWDCTQTLAELSREMTGTRFINWVHDVDVPKDTFDDLHLRAEHVAVSEVRRGEFCQKLGIAKAKCKVVPNGINAGATLGLTKNVSAFASRHSIFDREMVLFHPSRIVARKNIELTIETTAALCKMGIDAVSIVTGAADPHRPESQEYATKINTLIHKKKAEEHVLMAGQRFEASDEDVRGFYDLSDALFFPSKVEGFGLPLLEAAQHRLTVFCSDIPAHKEVAGKHAEYFALTEKPDAIAARIAKALKKDAFGARKREVVRQFSWERIYKDYLEPLLKAG